MLKKKHNSGCQGYGCTLRWNSPSTHSPKKQEFLKQSFLFMLRVIPSPTTMHSKLTILEPDYETIKTVAPPK